MERTFCLSGLLEVNIKFLSLRDGFVKEDFRQTVCLGQH